MTKLELAERTIAKLRVPDFHYQDRILRFFGGDRNLRDLAGENEMWAFAEGYLEAAVKVFEQAKRLM